MTAETSLPVLTAAFRALDESNVAWAVLRGDESTITRGGDLDLLVAPGYRPAVAAALDRAGLVPVPSTDEDPHAFFLGRGEGTAWLKLDVVDALTAGEHVLSESVTVQVLERRVRSSDRWLLDPDDEFWCLLVHHAGRRRGRPPDVEGLRRRAQSARTAGPVAAAVIALTSGGQDGEQVLEQTRRNPVTVAEALRTALHDTGSYSGRTPGVAARRLMQAVRALRAPNGLSVAILGPDGAGKTTLAQSLRRELPLPTRYVYLGVWREYGWDRWLRYVVGARLVVRLLRLGWRSVQVAWHRGRGRVVLLDRFTYDVLLPSDDLDRRGRITVALIRRLGAEPDLVLVLDAPAEVMYARKGEQGIEELERRRLTYLEITRAHPDCVVIDAARPAAQVLIEAEGAIWHALRRRWRPEPRPRA